MIEEPVKADEPKPFQLTKKLYRACMNKTIIEADGRIRVLQTLYTVAHKRLLGLKTMKLILKQLGGWPALEGPRWNDGDFDWRQSVYKFRTAGYSVDYFIDFSVGIDVKNSTKRIIDVSIIVSVHLSRTLKRLLLLPAKKSFSPAGPRHLGASKRVPHQGPERQAREGLLRLHGGHRSPLRRRQRRRLKRPLRVLGL